MGLVKPGSSHNFLDSHFRGNDGLGVDPRVRGDDGGGGG